MLGKNLLFGWLGALAGAVMTAGCGTGSPDGGDGTTGTVQIALMAVPADGTCVQVDAVGYRTVSQTFVVPAGSSRIFEMRGLPLGQVTFTAAAFGGGCPAPGAMAAPNWVSDAPFTATVAVNPSALITLNLVRNGSASVVIGFNDQPDGGTTQQGGSGGQAPPSPGSATSPAFMQLPGTTGESTVPGFEGWFTIDSVTIATATAATSGGGAGVGKTQWAASATLRFQKGSPQIYSAAALGKNLPIVSFVVQSQTDGAPPVTVWGAKLQNARIVAVKAAEWSGSSGDDVPTETVEFVFERIDLEAFNADGSSAIQLFWDLRRNVGSPPPNPREPLQFVVGGPADLPWKAVSAFRAPSETTAGGTTGGGAGTGKATFGDASVTLPIDASALRLLIEEVHGVVTPMGVVELRTVETEGEPWVTRGSYGFKNVVVSGLTLSGLSATMSFRAAGFSWTYGTETVTFP